MYRIPPQVEGQGGVVSLTLTQLEVLLFRQVFHSVLDQSTVQQLTQVHHLHKTEGTYTFQEIKLGIKNTI